MPKILCVVCGELAEYVVRKDYDIKHGGISVCGGCKPTRGVWALKFDAPGIEVVSGSFTVKRTTRTAPRTKGRLVKK